MLVAVITMVVSFVAMCVGAYLLRLTTWMVCGSSAQTVMVS